MTMSGCKYKILLLVALLLPLSAGAGVVDKYVSKIHFGGFMRATHVTASGMNLYVSIDNGLGHNIVIKSCSAVISRGGVEIMTIDLRDRVVVPKRSVSEVLLPLRFRGDSSMSILMLLRRILDGRIDDLTVTLTARVRVSVVSKTFSMQNIAMSEILDTFGVEIDDVQQLIDLL